MDLRKLNSLFEGFLPWISSLYDPGSGGFFYAHSSLTDSRFRTDIESTSQGINILSMAGMAENLPDDIKQGFIHFYRSRQNPSGYFLDPHNGMQQVDRMVARALSYSLNALRFLGAEPDYPPPGLISEELPDHLKSLKKFRRWLKNRPWDNAWMACDNISAASVYIRNMKGEKAQDFLDLLLPWLEEKQDTRTGLWGEGRPLIRISGAFKLALFYRNMGFTMPRGEMILQSLMKAVEEDEPEDFCWIRNPVELMTVLSNQEIYLPPSLKEKLLQISVENMEVFLREDGGFSRGRKTSLAVPNDQPLGLGLAEGDMNAGTQAVRIRWFFHKIAQKSQPSLPQGHLFSTMGVRG